MSDETANKTATKKDYEVSKVYPPQFVTVMNYGQVRDNPITTESIKFVFNPAPSGINLPLSTTSGIVNSRYNIEHIDTWDCATRIARLVASTQLHNFVGIFSWNLNVAFQPITRAVDAAPRQLDAGVITFATTIERFNALLLLLVDNDSIASIDGLGMVHFYGNVFSTTHFEVSSMQQLNALFLQGPGIFINTPHFRLAAVELAQRFFNQVLSSTNVSADVFKAMIGVALLGLFRLLLVKNNGVADWDHYGNYGPKNNDHQPTELFVKLSACSLTPAKDHVCTMKANLLMNNVLMNCDLIRIEHNLDHKMVKPDQGPQIPDIYYSAIGSSYDKHLGIVYYSGSIEPYFYHDLCEAVDIQVGDKIVFTLKKDTSVSQRRSAVNFLTAILQGDADLMVNLNQLNYFYSIRSHGVFTGSNVATPRFINPLCSSVIVRANCTITISVDSHEWEKCFRTFITRIVSLSGKEPSTILASLESFNKAVTDAKNVYQNVRPYGVTGTKKSTLF